MRAMVAGAGAPLPVGTGAHDVAPEPAAPAPDPDAADIDLRLLVNGAERGAKVHPFATLLETLRGPLALRGTKLGCGAGACGVCTVLLDGRRIKSCLALAAACVGHAITTIESVSGPAPLQHLQDAFVEHDALQCGFCTPGQILSATGFLAEPHTDPADPLTIRREMSGNLCRCGAYPNIVAAIASVAGAHGARIRE